MSGVECGFGTVRHNWVLGLKQGYYPDSTTISIRGARWAGLSGVVASLLVVLLLVTHRVTDRFVRASLSRGCGTAPDPYCAAATTSSFRRESP